MSGSRTLTLKLLADITNFNDNLGKGSKATQSFTDQVNDFSKKAAVAFTAAAVAVGAYVKAVVENAAADEAAQRKLALTIENTTNATAKQIAGVEDYISKTSMAIGITDDELRPALARLVRSTNDVEEAQKLLNLALDISTATGKPLETVANALGKAYDGNSTALGRLGLGIDSSVLKSKDFNNIFKTLTSTFGNFAENEAQSTEKQIARVKIALDEANESIGAALLPIVQELTEWLLLHFVPALQAVIGGLTGDRSVLEGLDNTYESFYNWGERIRDIIELVIRFKDELLVAAGVLGTIWAVSKISAGITATVLAINTLIKAYNALKASAFVAGVASAFALNPLLGVAAGVAGTAAIIAATKFIEGLGAQEVSAGGYGLGNPNLKTGSGGGGFGGGISVPSISGGGNVAGSANKTITQTAPLNLAEQTNQLLAVSVASQATGQSINTQAGVLNKLGAMDGTPQIVINVSGAIDPEGTSRTIVNTLNNSYYRGTGGAGGLVDLG